MLTLQLILIPSSIPTLGLYPNNLLAFSPLQYLVPTASNTLPLLNVVGVPVTHVTHSATHPAKFATLTGICTSHCGICPNSFHNARQKSRKVIGCSLEMKMASPAAVLEEERRFSTARTCASAILGAYVTSQRLDPGPITKWVSCLRIMAWMEGISW